MSKQKNHLAFYEKCMINGTMPHDGLCKNLDYEFLQLFNPTSSEREILFLENTSRIYWGYGVPYDAQTYNEDELCYGFTTLRQTLVLFMAAMNNEL